MAKTAPPSACRSNCGCPPINSQTIQPLHIFSRDSSAPYPQVPCLIALSLSPPAEKKKPSLPPILHDFYLLPFGPLASVGTGGQSSLPTFMDAEQ